MPGTGRSAAGAPGLTGAPAPTASALATAMSAPANTPVSARTPAGSAPARAQGIGCPRGARSLQVRPVSSSSQCSASLVGCGFGLICACLPGVGLCKSLWVIDWTAERSVLHAGICATTWDIRNNPSVDRVWAQQALAALDWRLHCALEDITRDGATTMASSRPPQRRRSPGHTRQRHASAAPRRLPPPHPPYVPINLTHAPAAVGHASWQPCRLSKCVPCELQQHCPSGRH